MNNTLIGDVKILLLVSYCISQAVGMCYGSEALESKKGTQDKALDTVLIRCLHCNVYGTNSAMAQHLKQHHQGDLYMNKYGKKKEGEDSSESEPAHDEVLYSCGHEGDCGEGEERDEGSVESEPSSKALKPYDHEKEDNNAISQDPAKSTIMCPRHDKEPCGETYKGREQMIQHLWDVHGVSQAYREDKELLESQPHPIPSCNIL